MNLIKNLGTRAFGGLTPEEKRAFVGNMLGKHSPAKGQGLSTRIVDTARTKLCEKFGFDRPKLHGSGHILYDSRGQEYLDFVAKDSARSCGENPSNPWESEYLVSRIKELQAAYPLVIKAVSCQGSIVDLKFQAFNGDCGSGAIAYFSLNDYLAALFSAYMLKVHRIVTEPIADDSHGLSLQPPHTGGRTEIDRAVDAIEALCDAVDRGDAYQFFRHLLSTTPTPVGNKQRYVNQIRGPSSVGPQMRRHHQPAGKFAFLVHFTTERDYVRSDPSFVQFTGHEFERWKEWSKSLGPGVIHRIEGIGSPAGCFTEGWLIALPMLPKDMLTLGRRRMLPILEQAVRLANDRGAAVLGLGGFTSIVSGGGTALTGKGPAITSGNTLTTVMAIEGIEDVMARAGLDLSQAHAAVVGASGSTGRLAALMLASRVGSLTLVGNPSNPNAMQNCREIASEIHGALLEGNRQADGSMNTGGLAGSMRNDAAPQAQADHLHAINTGQREPLESGEQTPIRCSVDPETSLLDADLVLVATNSDAALIQGHHLKEGAIVCDVARPPNVADNVTQRRNVLVFDGGLVSLPQQVDFGHNQDLPPGVCWGCLGETILLALEGETADHSIGPKLTLTAAEHLAGLARKHGFKPAPPQWYGRRLSEADFRRIRAHVPARLHGYRESERGKAWRAA